MKVKNKIVVIAIEFQKQKLFVANKKTVFNILYMIIHKSTHPDPVSQIVHTGHCRGSEPPSGIARGNLVLLVCTFDEWMSDDDV